MWRKGVRQRTARHRKEERRSSLAKVRERVRECVCERERIECRVRCVEEI